MQVLIFTRQAQLVDAPTPEEAAGKLAQELYGRDAFAWRASGHPGGAGIFCIFTLDAGTKVLRTGESFTVYPDS